MRGPGIALGVAAALACGGPAQLRYEDELARTPAPAEHAVHGERLVELMRGVDRLRTERLPRAMDVETERAARAALVAEVALAMARSAEQIPSVADLSALAPQERRDFRSSAEELRRSSRQLAERAQQRPPVDLDAALAAVEATCDGCHVRFRAGGLGDGG